MLPKLMVSVMDLIQIVIAYGGHILMKNPSDSKFWTQPFMSDIEAAINTKHNGRSFLLNHCRVGGTYFFKDSIRHCLHMRLSMWELHAITILSTPCV